MSTPDPVPPAVNDFIRGLIPGVVRTLVPVVVSMFAAYGVHDDRIDGITASILTVIVTGVYYVVIRFLEATWPKIGWFLGYPVSPKYQTPPTQSRQPPPPPTILGG